MPSAKVSNVGLIAKPRSERAARLVPDLIAWLMERGIAVRLDEETAIYAGRTDGLSRSEVAAGSQFLVVLGGDGTLLSGRTTADYNKVVFWCVHLGRLKSGNASTRRSQ